jgi:hypothetical protein
MAQGPARRPNSRNAGLWAAKTWESQTGGERRSGAWTRGRRPIPHSDDIVGFRRASDGIVGNRCPSADVKIA